MSGTTIRKFTVAVGRRPTNASRMSTAAKVLRRFDIQTLMMSAQVPERRTAERWLASAVRSRFLTIATAARRIDDRIYVRAILSPDSAPISTAGS